MNSWEALLQTIKDLCSVCEAQRAMIAAQADALAQMGAVVLEEERLDLDRRCESVIWGEPFARKEV